MESDFFMIYIQKTIKLNDNLQELYLMYLKLNSIVIQNIKKNMKHYNFKIELNIFCFTFHKSYYDHF